MESISGDKMSTIGVIGSGNMAEAIIKGILASGLYKSRDIMASDVRPERLESMACEYKIKTTLNNQDTVRHAEVILVCVKPQNVKTLLDEIGGKLDDKTLVISIAAGVTSSYLSKRLLNCQIIRAMPNTPAMVGCGVTALYSANAAPKSMELAVRLFGAVGKVVVVDKEELIDAVTAVSGSGPAYFFLLMEELVKTGQQLGLPAVIAEQLVLETAYGAGVLARQAYANGESPADLRRKVTSPRGTTEAAIAVFQKHNLGEIVRAALECARQRSIELSKETENR
jgi:pyrroline-5-carboxylate reductase